jgi:hypothetical protein
MTLGNLIIGFIFSIMISLIILTFFYWILKGNPFAKKNLYDKSTFNMIASIATRVIIVVAIYGIMVFLFFHWNDKIF